MAYWAIQGGYGSKRSTDPYGIFVAFSPDGLSWTPHGDKYPQIIGQSQSVGIVSPYADQVDDGMKAMDNTTDWPIPFASGDVVDVYFDPVSGLYISQVIQL